MRPRSWARWATCALAVSLCVPALADRHKTVADCTSFTQQEKGDDAVELGLHNACHVPIDCQLAWRVVCAPDSKKRRSEHPGQRTLTLAEGASDAAIASASVCEEDAWQIDAIQWSCQPAKD